jgi:hypothetical protein
MNKVIVGPILALLLLTGCSPLSTSGKDLKTTTASATASEAPTPTGPAPTPADFTIAVIETQKNCYGSAGCNVTYRIDPTFLGVAPDASQSFTVIYELTGGKDPETGSFEMQGTKYNRPSERMISTDSSGAVLTATVTQVLED